MHIGQFLLLRLLGQCLMKTEKDAHVASLQIFPTTTLVEKAAEATAAINECAVIVLGGAKPCALYTVNTHCLTQKAMVDFTTFYPDFGCCERWTRILRVWMQLFCPGKCAEPCTHLGCPKLFLLGALVWGRTMVVLAAESFWKMHSSFLEDNAAISNTLLADVTATRNLSLSDFSALKDSFVITCRTSGRLQVGNLCLIGGASCLFSYWKCFMCLFMGRFLSLWKKFWLGADF